MKKNLFCPVIFSIIFLLMASGPLHALMVIPKSLDEMAQRAELIFVGKCIAREPTTIQPKDFARPIYVTRYTFEITEWIKGQEGAVFSYYQDGLSKEDRKKMSLGNSPTFSMYGMPDFEVGWEGLLFLGKASVLGLRSPVGMQQGIFDQSESEGHVPILRNRFRIRPFRSPQSTPSLSQEGKSKESFMNREELIRIIRGLTGESK